MDHRDPARVTRHAQRVDLRQQPSQPLGPATRRRLPQHLAEGSHRRPGSREPLPALGHAQDSVRAGARVRGLVALVPLHDDNPRRDHRQPNSTTTRRKPLQRRRFRRHTRSLRATRNSTPCGQGDVTDRPVDEGVECRPGTGLRRTEGGEPSSPEPTVEEVRSPHEVGSMTVPTSTVAPRAAQVFAGQLVPDDAFAAATRARTGIGHGAAIPEPSPTARWTGTRPGKRRPNGSSGHSGCFSETAVETATVAAKTEAAPTIAVSLMAHLPGSSGVGAPSLAENLATRCDVKGFGELSLYDH